MAQNTDTKITAQAWAEITIRDWVRKAAEMNVSPDHPINAERFVHHIVTSADGKPELIQFMYDYYLNFIDWGVGKGVPIDLRDMLISSGATTRRPKPFLSDVFYYQVGELTRIMAEKYARKAAHVIVTRSKSED